MKRIRLSFSKKGSSHLDSFECHNRKLRHLLDSNEKLIDLMEGTPDDDLLGFIESAKNFSSNVYDALSLAWNCQCRDPHAAAFLLRGHADLSRPAMSQISFTLPRNGSYQQPQTNRDVIIAPHKPQKTLLPTSSERRDTKIETTDYLSTLRKNFAQPSAPITLTSLLNSEPFHVTRSSDDALPDEYLAPRVSLIRKPNDGNVSPASTNSVTIDDSSSTGLYDTSSSSTMTEANKTKPG